MNFEIVFASSNMHKVQEVRNILSSHGVIVYGLNDLNIDVNNIDENGSTYYENALIKAKAVASLTTLPVIADDSGLEIEALDNKPGLYSARYAKECSGHANAIKEILKNLKDKNNRNARFICDVVLLNVEDKPLRFEGICVGQIGTIPQGQLGFGYDPIFIPDGYKESFALIKEEEKNKISHRAKALKKLITYLKINGLCR